jgi:hypothetical protein
VARIEVDPNYTSPTFARATAPADAVKLTDIQQVAAALSTHDHSTGKGLPLNASAIPSGSITSAMIADGAIATADLAGQAVTTVGYIAGSTSDPTTTSASFVDLPDMTISLTSAGGPIALWFSGTFSISVTTAVAQIAFGLDGTDVGGMFVPQPGAANQIMHAGNLYLATGLSVGAHTLKCRWNTCSGTLNANGTARYFVAVEFKR